MIMVCLFQKRHMFYIYDMSFIKGKGLTGNKNLKIDVMNRELIFLRAAKSLYEEQVFAK